MFTTGSISVYVYVKARLSQWRLQNLVRGAQNYMKLFVAHKMTRYTLNKVHVAATELPQLLSQNTNMFVEAPHKVAVRLCAAVKLTETVKLLEVEEARTPVPHSWRRHWLVVMDRRR